MAETLSYKYSSDTPAARSVREACPGTSIPSGLSRPFWTASLSMALLRLTPHRTAVQLGILKGGYPDARWVPVAGSYAPGQHGPETRNTEWHARPGQVGHNARAP